MTKLKQVKAWATAKEQKAIARAAKKAKKSISRHLIDSALNHETRN